MQRSLSGPYGGLLFTLGVPNHDDHDPAAVTNLGYGLAIVGGVKPDWDFIQPWAEGGLGFGALWGDGARAVGPEGRWGAGLDLPYGRWGLQQSFGMFASGKAIYDVGLTDGTHVPPGRWLYSLAFGVRFTVTVPVNQVASPTSCAPTCKVYDK